MSASILPGRLDGLALEAGGRRLIDGLSLTLEAGPRTVILGPNGAGKSLILRLCHGLLQPSGGSIEWCGPGAEDADRELAMVFQRPVLLRRSVAANVEKYTRLISGAFTSFSAPSTASMASEAKSASSRPKGVINAFFNLISVTGS